MIGLLCFVQAMLASPFKSKMRLEAENAVLRHQLIVLRRRLRGPVAELVGIEGGVVSGVINLESSGVEASDWRPRHDEQYYEA